MHRTYLDVLHLSHRVMIQTRQQMSFQFLHCFSFVSLSAARKGPASYQRQPPPGPRNGFQPWLCTDYLAYSLSPSASSFFCSFCWGGRRRKLFSRVSEGLVVCDKRKAAGTCWSDIGTVKTKSGWIWLLCVSVCLSVCLSFPSSVFVCISIAHVKYIYVNDF